MDATRARPSKVSTDLTIASVPPLKGQWKLSFGTPEKRHVRAENCATCRQGDGQVPYLYAV